MKNAQKVIHLLTGVLDALVELQKHLVNPPLIDEMEVTTKDPMTQQWQDYESYMSFPKAAKLVNRSASTIHRLKREGKIESKKIGEWNYVLVSSLLNHYNLPCPSSKQEMHNLISRTEKRT